LLRLVRRFKSDADGEAAIEFLAKVAHQDVVQLPDGTYKIARGTASGRSVSRTDPEARHGRKSESQPITGFKTHVLATTTSLFVTGIKVTDASIHDSKPTPDMIDQAAASGLRPVRALGDGAYGTGANIRACAERGVEMLTKQGGSGNDGLTKRDFEIDLDAMSATCPAGHTSMKHTWVKDPDGAKNADNSDVRVPAFKFPTGLCRGCPLAAKCGKNVKTHGRSVRCSAYEAELQRIKRFNATAESKPLLRRRCAIELLSHLVRMGMRQGRFFGLAMVQFQAFMTAAAYNLQRFITLSAARS
ncbi:MAG: transposase, partial [Rhodoglobus sp.]